MSSHTSLTLRKIKNKSFFILILALTLLGMIPLFLIFSFIFKQGFPLISWEFLSTPALNSQGQSGGIWNAIAGTLIIIGIATLIAVPQGILIGTYLAEYSNTKLAKFTGLMVDILQGIPSIVIGVICWAFIVKPMESFSALSASIALALIMTPLIVKSTEETLKLLPLGLKFGSLALGAPYWKTIIKVVLPAGISGISNGVLLAIARVTGETAPLLFTALGSRFTQYSLFKEIEALPLLVYNYARDPDTQIQGQAWGAALVLLSLVLGLNLISKFLIRKWKWNQ